VYIACDFVQVAYASYNLSKRHAHIIVRKSGTTVSYKDVMKGSGGTIKGEVEVGVGSVFSKEEGQGMLVT
jgi:hypothetical protein